MKKPNIKELTRAERKIYKAILAAFPSTDPWTAWDYAIQGGTNFQLINKH